MNNLMTQVPKRTRADKRNKKQIVEDVQNLMKNVARMGQQLLRVIQSVNTLNDDFNKLTRLSPVQDLKEGDTVVVDYFARLKKEDGTLGDSFAGGQGKGLFIRSLCGGELIPGLEEQLVGKSVGDTTEIELTFPEDYGNENLASKEVVFFISILESLRESKSASFVDSKIAEYHSELQKRAEETRAKAEAEAQALEESEDKQ